MTDCRCRSPTWFSCSLRRKILQQRDLLVRERSDFATPNRKVPEEPSLFAQSRSQLGSRAIQLQDGQPCAVAWLNRRPGSAIEDVHDVFTADEAAAA